MSLKEKVENHFMTILIVSGLAVGTTVYGITVTIKNSECENAIFLYKEKINNFKLVSNDSVTFDISKLIIGKNENLQNIENLQFYISDHFYGLKKFPGWEYFFLKESEIGKKVTNLTDKEFQEATNNIRMFNGTHGTKYNEYETKYPLHLWRFKTPISVDCKGKKTIIYPHITIQRYDAEAMMYLAENAVNETDDNLKKIYESVHEGKLFDSTAIDNIRVMIYGKMKKGFDQFLFYSKTFNYAEQMSDLNIDFELSKVAKSGDYEYARIVWKNTYCESDPKLAIFIIEEFFILKMKDEIFLINIKIPSITPNPNNAVYSDIVNFLMNTRFIK